MNRNKITNICSLVLNLYLFVWKGQPVLEEIEKECCFRFSRVLQIFLLNRFCAFVLSVQETVVSEEIMHNLDTCEVTVVGDELDGEHESLEVDMSQLQQRSLEMSSSNVGLVITGTDHRVRLGSLN